jgi:hypothetical protein
VSAAVLVAGCGGDGRLSPEEFHTKVSAICRARKMATDRIPAPKAPGDVEHFLTRGLALERPALRRLAAIKPPADLDGRYRQTVDVLRRELALIAGGDREIRRGADPIRIFGNLRPRLAPLRAQEEANWKALKLPDCENS